MITLLTASCQSPPPPDNLWGSLEDKHREELVERLAAGYQDVNGKCREISVYVGSDESSFLIRIECGDQFHVEGQSLRL